MRWKRFLVKVIIVFALFAYLAYMLRENSNAMKGKTFKERKAEKNNLQMKQNNNIINKNERNKNNNARGPPKKMDDQPQQRQGDQRDQIRPRQQRHRNEQNQNERKQDENIAEKDLRMRGMDRDFDRKLDDALRVDRNNIKNPADLEKFRRQIDENHERRREKRADGMDHRVNAMEAKRMNDNNAVKRNIQDPSIQRDTANILICTDAQTLPAVPTLINSVLLSLDPMQHLDEDVIFYLVVDSEMSKTRLLRWLLIHLPNLNFYVTIFPKEWVSDKIAIRGRRKELATPVNFARYYVTKLFPEMSGRVVFLDTDTIVRDDIFKLRDIQLQPGKEVAAFVEDCERNRYNMFLNFSHPVIAKLNLDPMACSINAGVYVADLKLWKELEIESQLEYWMKMNVDEPIYGSGPGGGGSQPPILIVFYSKHAKIPNEWHLRHLGWRGSDSYTKEFVDSAKILHWNGSNKPWYKESRPHRPELWFKYCLREPDSGSVVNLEEQVVKRCNDRGISTDGLSRPSHELRLLLDDIKLRQKDIITDCKRS